jgi:predicted DNA-binding protein
MTRQTSADSVRLSGRLKVRIEKLAVKSGKTISAFVIAALEEHVSRCESLADQFLAEAILADQEMQRTGAGYEATQVHAYLSAKAKGKKTHRPLAKHWR